MLAMRKFIVVVVLCSLLLGCSGCTPQEEKAFHEEMARSVYGEMMKTEFGPIFVTSVIGATAPTGGPSVIQAFCWDRTLHHELMDLGLEPGFPKSIFFTPDPDRPLKLHFVFVNGTLTGIEPSNR
jgi:hypothetical protein